LTLPDNEKKYVYLAPFLELEDESLMLETTGLEEDVKINVSEMQEKVRRIVFKVFTRENFNGENSQILINILEELKEGGRRDNIEIVHSEADGKLLAAVFGNDEETVGHAYHSQQAIHGY
jgi:hypothetical protein